MKDFYSHKNELWAGCIWYKIYEVMVRKATEYVTFKENLEIAKEIGLNVCPPEDFQGLFDKLLKKYGDNATVAFVPYGRYSVLTEKNK